MALTVSAWNVLLALLPAVLPYIILYLLHNYLAIPLAKRSRLLYVCAALLLFAALCSYVFITAPVQHGPDGLPGPPPPRPDGVPPLPGTSPGPPPGPPPGVPPLQPEWLKIVLGLLVIGLNWGVHHYFELKKQREENRRLQDEKLNWMENGQASQAEDQDKLLVFKSGRKSLRIHASQISFVESMGAYLKIHVSGQEDAVLLGSLTAFVKDNQDSFVRIHKTYAVNIDAVREAGKSSAILEDGTSLPVGEAYRDAFISRLSGKEA